MNDLDTARLVLISVAAVDAGCVTCVQGGIDEAFTLAPELPWDDAVSMIPGQSRRRNLIEAIESARTWLAAGNSPRVDDDLMEISVS